MAGTDLISRQAAIDEVINLWADKPFGNPALVEIKDCIEALPSAQPEQIARDIATIIENEKDMRVMLKNAEHTETHSCVDNRTETHESCTDCPLYDHDRHNCPRFNKVIPRTIEEVKPRWIPVTERLPEEDGQYLITVKYKHVNDNYEDIYAEHGEWFEGKWDMFCFGHCGEVEGIIAWMPLPEPYAERRHEGGEE